MANECGRAGIKTPKPLKANVRTNRVGKSKGTRCNKKRDKPLANPDKNASVGEIRRGLSSPKKRKKKTADEHPLAKAFNDSLSKTTSHISTKLPQKLSDKLQIALSRITATTARSRMYLVDASELKSRLLTSSPLLSAKFKEEVVGFREIFREKTELLDELWTRWVECVNEIGGLGIGEDFLKRKGKEKDNSMENNDPQQGGDKKHYDDAKDDEEFDRLLQEIKVVGKVWTKKMEDSEKRITDEVHKQQQLAATVLL